MSLGALSALLLHNQRDEIGTMVVPQVNYNRNFGTTASVFGAFYPAPGRHWEVHLSKSSHVNEDYDLKFRDRTLLDTRLDLTGELSAFTDGSARFFGLRPDHPHQREGIAEDLLSVLHGLVRQTTAYVHASADHVRAHVLSALVLCFGKKASRPG